MKRKVTRNNKSRQYQIAGTLLVVASLGFASVYLQERVNQKEQLQAQQEEQQDTESVSSVVEPEKKNEVETVQPQVPVTEEASTEGAQETAAEPQVLHFAGEIQWPLEGDILLNYSMDHTVYFKTLQQYQYNPAVIISGAVNDKVISAASGMVTSISTDAKTGRTVQVDLGDRYTAVYGQLKEIPVAEGDTVSAGDIIGYVSEPTKYYLAEGSNLYFQLLKDGESINPMEYIE